MTEKDLSSLSHDFLNIEVRADNIAKERVRRAGITTVLVTALLLLAGIVPTYADMVFKTMALQDEITQVHAAQETAASTSDVLALEEQVRTLQKKVHRLETKT